MTNRLNEIHQDIGELKGKVESILEQIHTISSVVETVIRHDEKIRNFEIEQQDQKEFIDKSKIRQWTFTGITLACSAALTAFLNHIISVKIP